MLTGINPQEVAGVGLLCLLALIISFTYRAERALAADRRKQGEALHDQAWLSFAGILLIGVFCWLLARAILGPGAMANRAAVCLFIIIGANLTDEFDTPASPPSRRKNTGPGNPT